MSADPEPPATAPDQQPSVFATGLCGGVAVVFIVLGLIIAAYLLIDAVATFLSGIRGVRTSVHLTGWSFVATCVYASWRLFCHPSYRCLWSAMPAAILYAVMQWLLMP